MGGTVSTVKAGLTVKLEQASRLLCNLGTVGDGPAAVPAGGVPSITVTEGFARAWEENAIGVTDTMITVKMLNLPKGVNLRWPNKLVFSESVPGHR